MNNSKCNFALKSSSVILKLICFPSGKIIKQNKPWNSINQTPCLQNNYLNCWFFGASFNTASDDNAPKKYYEIKKVINFSYQFCAKLIVHFNSIFVTVDRCRGMGCRYVLTNFHTNLKCKVLDFKPKPQFQSFYRFSFILIYFLTDGDVANCIICGDLLTETCNECQEKEGDETECGIAWGKCGVSENNRKIFSI